MYVIFDGNNLGYTVWYGKPAYGFSKYPDTSDYDYEIVQVIVLSFIKYVASIIEHISSIYNIDDIFICWDSKDSVALRRKIFSEYKRNRKPKLRGKLNPVKFVELLRNEFTKVSKKYGLQSKLAEADDLIGVLCKIFDNNEVCIVSTDQDMYQLVDDTTFVYNAHKRNFIDKFDVYSKLAVYPKQIVRYKALCGDYSDNYPGVEQIGAKRAANLIKSGAKISKDDFDKVKLFEKLAKIPYSEFNYEGFLQSLLTINFSSLPNWGYLVNKFSFSNFIDDKLSVISNGR